MARDRPPNRIREHRKLQGLTLRQLAEKIGPSITYQTISKIENAVLHLTDSYLDTFSKALGVSKAELLIEGQQGVHPQATAAALPAAISDDEERAAVRRRKLLSVWESLTPEQQEGLLFGIELAKKLSG